MQEECVPGPSSISSDQPSMSKKGKHFKGDADHWKKPAMRTGDHVLAMVNDLHVIFGKGPDALAVPSDAGDTHPCGRRNLYFGTYPTGKT